MTHKIVAIHHPHYFPWIGYLDELAAEMGQNGRRAIKESLNWGAEEKKLLSLYAELLRRE